MALEALQLGSNFIMNIRKDMLMLFCIIVNIIDWIMQTGQKVIRKSFQYHTGCDEKILQLIHSLSCLCKLLLVEANPPNYHVVTMGPMAEYFPVSSFHLAI